MPLRSVLTLPPRVARWLFRECFQELDLERKSAMTALSWGVWVIALNSFDSSPAFRYLIITATWLTGPRREEWFWGLLCITAGGCQLFGTFTDRRRMRMGAALFAATLWSCLASAFALHNAVGTGALVYGYFAYSNAALFYQVGTGKRGPRGRFNIRVPLTGGTPP